MKKLKLLLSGSGFSYLGRRAAAFMLTFYISYLFFHFVVLNIQNYESVIAILSYIFVVQVMLDMVGIAFLHSTTGAGFAFSIKYENLKQGSGQKLNLTVRTLLTSLIFYVTIYGIFLTGWQLSAFATGLLITLALNLNLSSHRDKKMSALDWLTGCRPLRGRSEAVIDSL
ncbi:MAG: hypothetical protein HWE26_16525 [Alteromonadaceae bacterium]|nr:hypothetical protein [Alteromonadaceae bacterium]